MSTQAAAPDLEQRSAEEVLAYAVERFHPELVMACSFQKEESVMLDMLMRIDPAARVFTLDTGVLFDETRAAWRAFEERWGVRVEVHDVLSPAGEEWTRERCCSTGGGKADALRDALDGARAWITGVRREQSPTRGDAAKLEWDERNGLWKVNPLADWTDSQLWTYISEHSLPYNELHDEGYSSIGCAPCTLPGDGRAGRWAGSAKTECGLHGDS
ncbi:MAG TPA: phosphoadenylyl-sulfate reductase [Solirubrobacteraceae bacterium]|jgi:phosphoadenosine phosphosulfate reductase|nr:phosphoadenylyl-sulfate reductase [Solirubrobacteraceae bacterium]